PAGYSPTTPLQGGNPNGDSNGSPASVTVSSGSSDLSIDFGFVKPEASIGDFAWIDANGNGKQDTGEPGLAGVIISVSGQGTKTTDAAGKYSFTGLSAGTYTVSVTSVPSGFVATTPNATGNGGGEQLFRHGTAALLNSVYQSGVSFPYTAAQVIKMVHDAWVSGDATKIEATHTALANANQQTCPLN